MDPRELQVLRDSAEFAERDAQAASDTVGRIEEKAKAVKEQHKQKVETAKQFAKEAREAAKQARARLHEAEKEARQDQPDNGSAATAGVGANDATVKVEED